MEKSLISNFDEMVPCMLFKRKVVYRNDYTDDEIYKFFKIVGRPSDNEKCGGYPFNKLSFSCDGDRFGYDPEIEPEEWEPWEVPRWAIHVAKCMVSMIRKSNDIGVEEGYTRGLREGKNFVTRLASGSMSVDGFDTADDRNETRLNPKKWSDY